MIQTCLKFLFAILAAYLLFQIFFPVCGQEVDLESLIRKQNHKISNTFLKNKCLKKVGFKQSGNMSWYGPGFHGQKTASGDIYNQNFFTAAHKEMELGSFLLVINPENKKRVIVKVNDRGPFVKNRDLDLSKAAAVKLALVENGIMDLEYQKLEFYGS